MTSSVRREKPGGRNLSKARVVGCAGSHISCVMEFDGAAPLTRDCYESIDFLRRQILAYSRGRRSVCGICRGGTVPFSGVGVAARAVRSVIEPEVSHTFDCPIVGSKWDSSAQFSSL